MSVNCEICNAKISSKYILTKHKLKFKLASHITTSNFYKKIFL